MRELSLSILDLAQNSIRFGASNVCITVTVDNCQNKLTICVEDDGLGIEDSSVYKISDPFYTTSATHKVGLGVPLFIQRALMTGGSYDIQSEKGKGTVVSAVFDTSSIDCVPLGDVSGAICCLVASAPDVGFVYHYKCGDYVFHLDTLSLFKMLNVEQNSFSLKAALVKEYLKDFKIQ